MDPITLIVMALAAGASSGAIDALKDNAKEAAKAAYGKLHDLVRRRFQGNASAEAILAEHQADPDTYKLPLAKKLADAGAGNDADLVTAAAEVMKLADPAGGRAGKFNVAIHGGQGIVIGDGTTAYFDFSVEIYMRERDHRVDAASLRSLNPYQIVEVVRVMSPKDGEFMLAEAEADAAMAVLGALLQMDEALAVALLADLRRDKAADLTAVAAAKAPGREWLRQLPEAAEAIAKRGEELRWTTPGRLERAGHYLQASSSGGRLHRKVPPPDPVYRRAYENGCIYWCGKSGGNGARALAGVILEHYITSGGCGGRFGIPVGEETRVTFAADDWWVQRFSSGAIYRHQSSVIEVERAVAEYLERARGAVDHFYPIGQKTDAAKSPYASKTPDAPDGTHGWKQRFQGAVSASSEETVYYLERAKAHGVSGEIASYYKAQGGAEGWLGYPTSDAADRDTKVTQDFEGGTVFAGLPGTKAVAVPGASMTRIRNKGMLERLGFPVTTEEKWVGHGGDTWQFFENGVVTFRNKKREVWVRPDQA